MLASGPAGASPGAGPGPAPFAKGGFLKDLVFHVLSRFSMPRARARGQARPAWPGWAGQAWLPLQREVSYRGSVFLYLADFRCRARARAARLGEPGWGLHGLHS